LIKNILLYPNIKFIKSIEKSNGKHSHEEGSENCLYQKQCEEYNKSVKELTKLYEDLRKRYEILNMKANQEYNLKIRNYFINN